MNGKGILGHDERGIHVAAIRSGSPCCLVMCIADDVDAGTRKIRGFNEDEVFLGGELLDTGPAFVYPQNMAPHVRRLTSEGATWVRRGQRRPVREIR